MFKIRWFFIFSALILLSNCRFSKDNNPNTNFAQSGDDNNNPPTNPAKDAGFTIPNIATKCLLDSESGKYTKAFVLNDQNDAFLFAIQTTNSHCSWNTISAVAIGNKENELRIDYINPLVSPTEDDKANIYLAMHQLKQAMQEQIIQKNEVLKQKNIISRNILDVFRYINDLTQDVVEPQILDFKNKYHAVIIANINNIKMEAHSYLIKNLNLSIEDTTLDQKPQS